VDIARRRITSSGGVDIAAAKQIIVDFERRKGIIDVENAGAQGNYECQNARIVTFRCDKGMPPGHAKFKITPMVKKAQSQEHQRPAREEFSI
jgi:hypothetical protein